MVYSSLLCTMCSAVVFWWCVTSVNWCVGNCSTIIDWRLGHQVATDGFSSSQRKRGLVVYIGHEHYRSAVGSCHSLVLSAIQFGNCLFAVVV